jgi:hypothetical protein
MDVDYAGIRIDFQHFISNPQLTTIVRAYKSDHHNRKRKSKSRMSTPSVELAAIVLHGDEMQRTTRHFDNRAR